ncbi:carbohydrate kinase family protein [Streptomyces sp. NPDC060048]|uniref:carbohydrate kinase family protein n=1 Tax=unclassified Streptomyces TaxID=2593676 RepID=UPI00368294BB
MRIAVTGSIATDHLMAFPRKFSDQLIPEQLDKISLSLLTDELEIRHGGVAANIAFGLGSLGLSPLLAGAAGVDFSDHQLWLKAHGVDTDGVRISETLHTARFVCASDTEQNQIGFFYAGAMAEAHEIDLGELVRRTGAVDLVVVSPNDPAAMLRHTRDCVELGIPFVADPSQQLARLERDEVRALLDGPLYLFTNAYESVLIQERSGWTERQILDRVGTWVTTHGSKGAHVTGADAAPLSVPPLPSVETVDPTGAGDAFRSGFLAALAWGLGHEDAARLGSGVAALALESRGTQEYELDPGALLDRLSAGYGADTVERLVPHLRAL